jgi:hypothetical protein
MMLSPGLPEKKRSREMAIQSIRYTNDLLKSLRLSLSHISIRMMVLGQIRLQTSDLHSMIVQKPFHFFNFVAAEVRKGLAKHPIPQIYILQPPALEYWQRIGKIQT